MASPTFLPIENTDRLAIFSEVTKVVRDDMSPAEGHRALTMTLRRAYQHKRYVYVEVSNVGLLPGQFRITRVWYPNDTEGVPPNSPWRTTGVPVRSGGMIPQILAKKSACVVHDITFGPDDPAFAELGKFHSCTATPGASGEAGNWAFIFDEKPDTFDVEYLENFVLRVGLIGAVLSNLQVVRDLRRANAFIDSEIERIAGIQRALLPADVPNVPGLDVAALSETFDRAGGDLYDYENLDDGRWVFLIADASGHGPSAAVVAAMLNAILHAYCPQAYSKGPEPHPDDVLEFANEQLVETRIENSFVTAFLGLWNPANRTFVYARAGHNPPMLRKASGEIVELAAVGNLPLGMIAGTRYEHDVVKLEPGDIVVMYTDGVIDASNDSGDNFGEGRLRDVLKAGAPSAGDLLKRIRQAIQDHVVRSCPRDDQTIVVLKAK